MLARTHTVAYSGHCSGYRRKDKVTKEHVEERPAEKRCRQQVSGTAERSE